MPEKTRNDVKMKVKMRHIFFWLLAQLPWKWRIIKVTHLLLNFSYTVNPQGKTHLQTVGVQIGVNKNFSGICFVLCTRRKAQFTPMCVSWNAKLWSPDAPRAFRQSLPLPEEGELCCLFHLGLSEADVKLEPCLTWQWEYFGHSPRTTSPVWGFGCTPCHVPHWNYFRIFSSFTKYSRTSCHSSTLAFLYLLTRPVTMLSTE